ncbi:MAG: GNAT family N-acetyltransferase [Promicromonosporaceae bacterium]|nr:GNAT family N-acetyltransferase [Promicromonosporaceae bacterium]
MIATERLLLRRFTDADADAYAAILMKPEVTRYLGSGQGATGEGIAALREQFQAVWNDGYGVFAVVEQATGSLIGHCGIRPIPDGRIELLYAYDPATWGKGYATEAGRAALDYAREHFPVAEVIGMAYPQNHGSIAVLEKLGFQRIGTEQHFGHDLILLQLDVNRN